MTNKDTIKAAITELIINSDLDVDQVVEVISAAFPNEDAEVLGELFVEVMETLPELN